MREISPDTARATLKEREALGDHIDARLWREIEAPGHIYTFTLDTADDFLRLIWQEADTARFLTPGGKPRTLRDVAGRLLQSGQSFDALVRDLGMPRSEHRPEWFRPCVDIDGQFEMARFGWVVLTPATDGERNQSPTGTHYIFDGIHKSLVLAKRLLQGSPLSVGRSVASEAPPQLEIALRRFDSSRVVGQIAVSNFSTSALRTNRLR